ncbi:MAG: hypothetical protein ACRCTY_09900 [Candidatus Adiutrix sp.]
MSKELCPPQLRVYSEDSAWQAIVNGFLTHDAIAIRRIKTNPVAGGWLKLLEKFESVYVKEIKENTNNYVYVLLLLDLDKNSERRSLINEKILATGTEDRVFTLCAQHESESIKKDLECSGFEAIGKKLADSCFAGNMQERQSPWLCQELKGNQSELERLSKVMRSIIFPPKP